MNLENRLIYSQSWWIASEIVRRHPDFGVLETHPCGAQYDCLSIVRWCSTPSALIDLNRNGSIHVHPDSTCLFDWEEERQKVDRHWGVKTIEKAAGLDGPPKTPPASRRSISFRIFHQLLQMNLNSRENWDVRNARIDTDGYQDSVGNVDGFPTARESVASTRPDDPFSDALYRFWKVLRDGDVRFIIDIDGLLHSTDLPVIDLFDRYVNSGRSIRRVVCDIADLLS